MWHFWSFYVLQIRHENVKRLAKYMKMSTCLEKFYIVCECMWKFLPSSAENVLLYMNIMNADNIGIIFSNTNLNKYYVKYNFILFDKLSCHIFCNGYLDVTKNKKLEWYWNRFEILPFKRLIYCNPKNLIISIQIG